MSEAVTMQRYRCHKEVQALRITEVKQSAPDAPNTVGCGTWDLLSEGNTPVTVSHTWYCKHLPVTGGYLVNYEDGYVSYSPAEPFEKGYSLITPEAQ